MGNDLVGQPLDAQAGDLFQPQNIIRGNPEQLGNAYQHFDGGLDIFVFPVGYRLLSNAQLLRHVHLTPANGRP